MLPSLLCLSVLCTLLDLKKKKLFKNPFLPIFFNQNVLNYSKHRFHSFLFIVISSNFCLIKSQTLNHVILQEVLINKNCTYISN